MSQSFILTDIEGTTTSIDFVHKELFPYSRQRIANFISENIELPIIQNCLLKVEQTIMDESQTNSVSLNECLNTLIYWIDIDRKHTALKELQGLIWEEGYKQGKIKGHIYDDVIPMLNKWKQNNINLGVYSSGSIYAQKLLFSNTTNGNITPLFSFFFDTQIGGKREPNSYKHIINELKLSPKEILFLSDVEQELIAANEAGMQTIQLVRELTIPSLTFQIAKDFYEVDKLIS